MVGITAQERLVPFDRILLDRDRVGLLGRDRVGLQRPARAPLLHSGGLAGLEEHEIHGAEVRGVPGSLEAAGGRVGPQAGLREHLVGGQARLPDLLHESRRVGAVRALLVGGGDIRRRRERDEKAFGRLDEGKAFGHRAALPRRRAACGSYPQR
jgi:hypothetical protein